MYQTYSTQMYRKQRHFRTLIPSSKMAIYLGNCAEGKNSSVHYSSPPPTPSLVIYIPGRHASFGKEILYPSSVVCITDISIIFFTI